MNELLRRAIAQLSRLPEDKQETIARLIIEEMEAELGWENDLPSPTVSWLN